MGTKRPTKTTKSGRYMNPTDQARKEARRKELKKNKKQRMAVRQAVLKGKDPLMLVKELEQIEQMELETLAEALPTTKAIREKKMKMKETIDRVVKCYDKDGDKDMVEKINRAMKEYEGKRKNYVAYYQSKKDIQMDKVVQLQNIPLPDNIPLPKEKPPKLGAEDNHESVISLVSLPSNVDPPPAPQYKPPSCCIKVEALFNYTNRTDKSDSATNGGKMDGLRAPGPPPGRPPGPPPGPPPTMQASFPGPGGPRGMQGMQMRPPPGVVLYAPGAEGGQRHQLRPMFHNHSVPSNPYLNKGPDKYASATISAKATTIAPSSNKSLSAAPTAPTQNKQERVTRFVPVSVKLRQRLPDEPRSKAPAPIPQLPAPETQKPTDEVDAYSAFMSEMDGLM